MARLTSRRDALAHVFWIGGPGGAGKSTVSTLLAERHGLRLYRFDDTGGSHAARATDVRHPAFKAFIAMSMNERWLLRSPEEMAESAIQGWIERFELVVDDLLALPPQPAIVAEGIGLFPECVSRLPGASSRSVWLVQTPAFLRDCEEGRMGLTAMTARTSDPERALEKLLRRNELIAQHIRAEASRCGLRVIDIDESVSPRRAAELVEAQFGLGV